MKKKVSLRKHALFFSMGLVFVLVLVQFLTVSGNSVTLFSDAQVCPPGNDEMVELSTRYPSRSCSRDSLGNEWNGAQEQLFTQDSYLRSVQFCTTYCRNLANQRCSYDASFVQLSDYKACMGDDYLYLGYFQCQCEATLR